MFKILHIPTASFVRSSCWNNMSDGVVLRWESKDCAMAAVKFWNFGLSNDGLVVRELYYEDKKNKLPRHEFMVVEEDV